MTDDSLRWHKVDSTSGPELPLFRTRIDLMRHPSGAPIHRCLVLEAPDWVNVVAVTPDRLVVMVEQFRFGAGEIGLEPPAGIIEPGEDSQSAARRELLEETGYAGDRWRYLGAVQANPAFQNNRCHHWLVEDVKRLQAPTPDATEAIRVRLMSPGELADAFASGALNHVLAQSALARVFPLWHLPFEIDPSGADR